MKDLHGQDTTTMKLYWIPPPSSFIFLLNHPDLAEMLPRLDRVSLCPTTRSNPRNLRYREDRGFDTEVGSSECGVPRMHSCPTI